MANEIFGSELNVDFSGILQQAEAFDEKLKDIDHTAKQLGNTLRNALGNIDLGGIKSLKDNIERLGESKISLKVVGTEELGKMSSALDAIISQVDVFSKKANKQTVAPKTSALFDLEELQAKRDRAVAIIKDLEGQVRALNTQYQAALTERGAVRDSIGGISKDEISELQQQIKQLGQAMQQVGAGSGQNWRQSIQPYIDAINQLKDKITQIKEEEDSLFQTEGAKSNSRVAQLDTQYDGLYKTINVLLDEVDQIDSEMQSKIASNKAVEEQIKKIEEWKAKIKELEDDFTRLNAAGKAFGSDGKLTSEGADLTNRKAQLEEELKLMQMNASEAKRYSDSIIAQEQREADLAIQEEQRTTNAKIAEYNRLVSEEARLRKEAREQRKAIDNENLDPIGKSQAKTALDATVEEQQRVADRMVEIERELGDELNSIKQKALAAQLREVIRNNDEMLREQERAAREQERIEKENKKLEQEAEKAHYTENPQAAIDFSKSTQSINEQIKALQYLKAARDNLTVSAAGGESAYKQKIEELNEAIKETQGNIDKLKGKQEELRNNQSKLLNTTDQLQRKLALLFSVSAIQGYIGKVVAVRKEFELQQRSLEILLQNKEDADKIYGQTVQLALKSPFRVQELVKYTKQLAAYRIENDKLHDTTKRLADVSAGLGVDMQRLILAFGQVRAAEFLRGTELRQFTEAGIPMLEELSKYFSEMEGKAVSTGEVFERISKRGVLFKDVEEIFKRLTSEGGTFYQMQEKQAETLAGRISNMHDRIDLMLNDIGRSKDGMLTEVISVINSMLESWRMVADQIYFVSGALLFMKIRMAGLGLASKHAGDQIAWVGKKLTGLRSLKEVAAAFMNAKVQAKGFFGFLKVSALGAILSVQGALVALTVALSTFLPVIAITALTEAIYYFSKASEASREFEEAVTRINDEMSTELSNSISLYEKLAARVRDATNTEKDRNDALEEMKRHFKDILPDQYLELEYVKGLAKGYKEVHDAMTQYYNNKSIELKKSQVEEIYGKEFTTELVSAKHDFLDVAKIINDSTTQTGDVRKRLMEEKFGEGIMEMIIGGYAYAYENAADKLKNGEIETSASAFKEEVEKQLTEMYGGKDFTGMFETMGIGAYTGLTTPDRLEEEGAAKNIHELVGEAEKLKAAMAGIEGFKFQTPEMQKEKEAYDKLGEGLENLKKKYEDLKLAYSDYHEFKKKVVPENDTPEFESYEKEEDKLEKAIKDKYEELGISIPVDIDVSKIADSKYLIDQEMRNVGQLIYTTFAYTVNPILKNTALDMDSVSTSAQNASYRIQTITPNMDALTLSTDGFKIAMNDSTDAVISFEDGIYNATDTAFLGLSQGTDTAYNFAAAIEKGYDSVEQLGETVLNTAETLDPTPTQLYTNAIIDEVLKAAGVSMEALDEFRATNEHQLDTFTEFFHTKADEWLLTWYWVRDQIAANPAYATIILETINWTREEYEDAPQKEQALKRIKNRFPKRMSKIPKPKTSKKPKKSKSKSKQSDDPSDDYIEFLEDMYKKFQELSEDMSADAAKEEVIKAYTETFKKLTKLKGIFKEGISEIDFTTTEGLVDALKKIGPLITKSKDVWREYNLTISDYISDIKVEKLQELNDEADRQVDLLFEGYEIAKDLDKLGISPEWAKGLFGIKATDIKSLRAGVAAAYGDPEESKKTIKETSKNISEIAKGNVDVFNHQLMPAISLYTAGWEEAGQAAENTFFAVEKVVKDNKGVEQNILITPILPDGTILSPDELDAYINKNLIGKDILTADKKGKKKSGKGIVISVGAEENAEYLNQQAKMYYNAKLMEMAFGKERLETIQETNDKIDEEENKRQLERLEKYVEYAKKSVSERAKLKIEELTRLAEIEETFAVKDGDSKDVVAAKESLRAAAIEKSQKEYAEALKKLEWEEFQKSDTFIMMFEDLEFASEKLIRSTLEDLRNFKGEWANMPLEDMRAMVSKINELEGSLLKLQNPFKVTKKLKKELKGLYLPDLQMEAKDFESEIRENDNIIAQLETIRDLRSRGIGLEEYQVNLLYEVGLAENSTVYAINGMIAAREEANSKAKSALGITLDQINKFKELKKSYDAQKAVIETITEKAREVYDAFSELFKLFADEDSIGFAFAEMGMSMAESVAQAMVLQLQVKQTEIAMMSAGIEADSFAMKLNQAMGVVGWIVMGVQVISQVLGAIFGAKDKKLQKEIDKLDEDVEKLSKALEKLEDALEKNYAFASLRSDMQEINSNIDQQIAKRRRQIYLEKKKKETDKDQIKDWEDEIEELEEERAEAHREMIESLGGVDDYRSATREFVDAWVEAFNETGNGLQGLKDNFREFFKNIILEQAVMKGAGKIMEPLLDKINMSLGDYEIQGHEEQKIKALSEQKMKELDEFLNVLFGDNGMWNEWIDDKGQSLSGLQEGIQGVTEETAQIIEAYLNSIRFYIAQDNQNLADLRNFFIGSEEDTNPMLSQLRIIAQQTTAIYDLLDSVSRSGHSQGGKGIKVFID